MYGILPHDIIMDYKNGENNNGFTDWEQASKWFEERSKQLARGEIPEVSAQQQRERAEGYKPLEEDRLPIRPKQRPKKTASIKQLNTSDPQASRQKREGGSERVSDKDRRERPASHKPKRQLSDDDKRRMYAQDEKKKRKVRVGVGVAIGVCLAIVAGVLVSLFVLFGIENIEVVGDSRYTREEIITASGIELGENIFRVDRTKAQNNVYTALSYIGDVKISIKAPTTLQLEVAEASEKYALPFSKNFIILDERGKVLSRIAKSVPKGAIKLIGLNFAAADVGQSIVPAENNENKLELAGKILDLCEKYAVKSINSIGLENDSALYMIYDNRLKLYFGSITNIASKIEIGSGLIAQLNSENAAYTGVIMLSTQDKVYFKPGSINALVSSAQEYERNLAEAKKAAKKAKSEKTAQTTAASETTTQ